MDMRGKLRFHRQYIFIYLMGFSLILGMKYLYSKADCESLLWILGPTARWVEVLSAMPTTDCGSSSRPPAPACSS